MIYEVFADGEPLYYPGDSKYAISNPVLNEALNDAGDFSFDIPITNPWYSKLKNRITEIQIYRNGKMIFNGEVRETKKTTSFLKNVYCVGELAYLYCSIQPQKRYQNYTPKQFFQELIEEHNEQVEAKKQFTVGIVNITDPNDSIYRYTNREKTLDDIRDKLCDRLDGYLRIRHENGIRYIDLITLQTYGKVCNQSIEFGQNLMNFVVNESAVNIATAVVPLGARLEESKVEGLDAYTDITSVNDGKDYVYSEEAVKNFGWIKVVQNFDDVTVPANLKKKAEEWLKSNQFETMIIELTAIDLSILNPNLDCYEVGDYIPAYAEPWGMDTLLPLYEKQTYLQEPDKGTITLGNTKQKTYTQEVSSTITQNANAAQQAVSAASTIMQKAIVNATSWITGANGGYVILDKNTGGQPWRILVMDSPDKTVAKYVIQINQNGIGFSNTGINGPYRNAWTIDGNLVADFITAGNLVAGFVGGWSIGENLIRKEIEIDGYIYQIAMQSPNGQSTTNCYYVRRHLSTSDSNDDWEYLFRIRYDGTLTITRGTVGGWSINDTYISQKEILDIDGADYVYHICLQCVTDEKETSNFIFVRRYKASEQVPEDASGWEYLARINKYGNAYFQQLRARKSWQHGFVKITPIANTPTSLQVAFTEPMWRVPQIVLTPYTTEPGTKVLGVGVSDVTENGFTAWITRITDTETGIAWVAMAD